MGNGRGNSSSNKIITWDKQEVAPGRQNMRVACSNYKLEFNVFSSPWKDNVYSSLTVPQKCRRLGVGTFLISILLGDLTHVVIMLSNDVQIELINIEVSDCKSKLEV